MIEKIQNWFLTNYRSLDKGILYACFILIVFGIFLTLSASPSVAERNNAGTFHFVAKHLIFLIPAIITMFCIAFLPLKAIRILCALILTGGILGMILVLLIGDTTKGSQRWINLFGVSIQPSEFAKPAFAVISAWLLVSGRLMKNSLKKYALVAFLCLLIVCLLYKQPDVGMILTFFVICTVQVFLVGFPWKFIGIFAALGAGLLVMAYFTLNHVYERINAFLNPVKGENYQVEKSIQTLKNAGWFGKGPGEGIVKTNLPDAHTDFIMAVSAEEFGFLLTAFLIGTFAFLIIRGFCLVRKETNYFAQIALGGLLTQIAFQSIVNIASTLNLIPTKGMTLPFISYGGSSLVSTGLAVGIILALTRRKNLCRGLE